MFLCTSPIDDPLFCVSEKVRNFAEYSSEYPATNTFMNINEVLDDI